MARTGSKPSWLNEDDREEWQWAANYLSKHCPERLKDKLSLMAPTIFSSLVRSTYALEKEAEGVKLIQRLRNAIRQRRYRAAEGGRQTCSFTLPKATKAKLKTLAKGYKVTETRLIESLLESAAQQAAAKKQEALREVDNAKVNRSESKLAQELLQVRVDATKKQLHHCLKQLMQWETYLKEALPDLSPEDEATATALTQKRLHEIDEAIDAAVSKHRQNSPWTICGADPT